MFDWGMSQTITIQRSNGINQFAEVEYLPPEEIAGRLESSRKTVVDRDGKEVVSESRLFTLEKLNIDDCVLVDGAQRRIISLSPQYAIYGDFSHYEVRI